MSILLTENCVGCGACIEACLPKCIEFRDSRLGEQEAYITENGCTACGRCKIVCPAIRQEKEKPSDFFAYQNPDREALSLSQSGGAFAALANYVISNKGLIAGVRYNESFTRTEYTLITEARELPYLQKSKYIFTSPHRIYSPFLKSLKSHPDKIHLFVGLPCQVAAIKNLARNRDNLLTADLLCFGPMKLSIWEAWATSHLPKDIDDFQFRNKTLGGWGSELYSITSNGITASHSRNKFFPCILFQKGYCQRRACRSCKFRSIDRPGDITLGDFWGIEKLIPDLPESTIRKGISLIHFNTRKGQTLKHIFDNGFLGRFSDFDFLKENNGGYRQSKFNGRKIQRFNRTLEIAGIKPGLQIIETLSKLRLIHL